MISRSTFGDSLPMVRLGEVVTFLDHLRRPVKQSERTEGPYPYYGANGLQGTIDDFIFDEPLILVAEDGGHFDNPDRGIAYKITGKTWVNNHAHVLRPNENLDIDYLARVLENYDIRPFISGTTRGKLTKAQAERIEIPLPPLEEQKWIAGILDQADALRRLRARALEKLNTLGQAVFQEMFGDSTYERKPLKSLGQVITGSTPSTSNDGNFIGEIPFITPGDLESEKSNSRFVSVEGAKESRTVTTGATFVCCIGATIGKMGVAQEYSAFNQQINAVQWGTSIQPQYGFYALQVLKPEIQHMGKGAATTLPILKKSLFQELSIPVAPKDKQIEFERIVSEIEHQKAQIKMACVKKEALFSSLQSAAFQGKL